MADVQLGFVHYYHCTLTQVPLTLSLSRIPDCLLPHAASPLVRELAALGCRLVPHQLHLYKEKLPYKFGYVTFLINHSIAQTTTTTATTAATAATTESQQQQQQPLQPSPRAANEAAADAHALALRWLTEELPGQLAVLSCRVQLAQPPECYSAEPFLIAFNHLCSIVDPAHVSDSKRVATFVLSKVHFSGDGRNAHVNDLATRERHRRSMAEQLAEEEQLAQAHEAAARDGDDASAVMLTSPRQQHMHWMLTHWSPVGTLAVSALGAQEQAWLRGALPDFPAPQTSANDDKGSTPTTTTTTSAAATTPRCADAEAVRDYLAERLAPLILVTL